MLTVDKGMNILNVDHDKLFLPRGDRLVLKFKRRKDYLCSSAKSKKRKVVLHLLDVVNVLVFTGSSTLVIQVGIV